MSCATIPAACLEALGGLQDDDPPVLSQMDEPVMGGTQTFTWPQHPLDPDSDLGDAEAVLLPQSAPALLNVAARHIGHEPHEEGVLFFRMGTFWVLQSGVDGGAGCTLISFPDSLPDREGVVGELSYTLAKVPLDLHVPTITPDMDRLTALAEMVVWLARIQRTVARRGWVGNQWRREKFGWQTGDGLVTATWADSSRTIPDDPVVAMQEVEQDDGLPAWTVT